jgi:hypothetical protein
MLGVQDPVAFRRMRQAALQTALGQEADAVRRSNLSARIEQLQNFSTPNDIQTGALTIKVLYAHRLRHAAAVIDPDGLLPHLDTASPWNISYWMGSWDADALQAFVQGAITITTTA